MSDLIERLRNGLIEYDKRWSGDTHDDKGGPVDYEATDALMLDAATALAEAQAEIARLRDELAALRNSGDVGTVLCECGMSGPCMSEKCGHPFVSPHATKGEAG